MKIFPEKKKISRQSFEEAERVMLVIPRSGNAPTATPTDIDQLWRTNKDPALQQQLTSAPQETKPVALPKGTR